MYGERDIDKKKTMNLFQLKSAESLALKSGGFVIYPDLLLPLLTAASTMASQSWRRFSC